MFSKLRQNKTYMSQLDAEELVEVMSQEDPDWFYEAYPVPDARYFVAAYDEEGFFMGFL